MTFLQSGAAARNETFRLRIQACLFKLAQDVVNEDENADDHHTRISLARAIIIEPAVAVGRFAWLCAANPAIAGTVNDEGDVAAPDGDIEYVCASNWTIVSKDSAVQW